MIKLIYLTTPPNIKFQRKTPCETDYCDEVIVFKLISTIATLCKNMFKKIRKLDLTYISIEILVAYVNKAIQLCYCLRFVVLIFNVNCKFEHTVVNNLHLMREKNEIILLLGDDEALLDIRKWY